MKHLKLIAAIVLLASVSMAQMGVTVGPTPAPVGCPIAVTIANDTGAASYVPSPCPFAVRNAAGVYVFAPFCPAVIVPLAAGAVYTTYWFQSTTNGVPVPPGLYLVDVYFAGGNTTIPITIDPNVAAAVAPLGQNRIGTTRNLQLCSPQDAGFGYLMGASGPPVSGGIPTCGGIVPLELDALLLLSIGPNPFFGGFAGTLGSGGITETPSITVPFDFGLVGITFNVAFIVTDPAAPCIVRRISAPLVVTIV